MLYFISTPIGNLNDISLRAIDVIRSSDYLYAEDTRNIKKLLKFINLKVKSKSFHEHNENEVSIEIIEHLKNGKIVSISLCVLPTIALASSPTAITLPLLIFSLARSLKPALSKKLTIKSDYNYTEKKDV